MEERRLPQSLLEAAAAEQKARLAHREQGVPSKKKRGKKKTFSDSEGEGDDGFVEDLDEGELHFTVLSTLFSAWHTIKT